LRAPCLAVLRLCPAGARLARVRRSAAALGGVRLAFSFRARAIPKGIRSLPGYLANRPSQPFRRTAVVFRICGYRRGNRRRCRARTGDLGRRAEARSVACGVSHHRRHSDVRAQYIFVVLHLDRSATLFFPKSRLAAPDYLAISFLQSARRISDQWHLAFRSLFSVADLRAVLCAARRRSVSESPPAAARYGIV